MVMSMTFYTACPLILKGITAAANRSNRLSFGVLLDNLLDKVLDRD
jgi:hypothetical protein